MLQEIPEIAARLRQAREGAHLQPPVAAQAIGISPDVVVPSTDWIEDLYALLAQGEVEASIDLLFQRIDDLLLAERMAECDDILRTIDTFGGWT